MGFYSKTHPYNQAENEGGISSSFFCILILKLLILINTSNGDIQKDQCYVTVIRLKCSNMNDYSRLIHATLITNSIMEGWFIDISHQ